MIKKYLEKIYLFLIFILLYAPILTLIVLSFNNSKTRAKWGGFTLKWYSSLFQNEQIMNALYTTLIISLLAAVIATVIGTAAAIAIHGMKQKWRTLYSGLTNIPMMNAEIVMGVSLMLLFIAFHVTLGFGTILIAHITFNIPYVILSVAPKLRQTSRRTYEAALDLGASPLYAFFKVTFPDILPGVLSGFMLAFTMSLDDFVITHFTKGPGVDTLSTKIYSEVRKGIKPEMYALSTLLFVTVLVLLILVNVSPKKDAETAAARKHVRRRSRAGRILIKRVIPVAICLVFVGGGIYYASKGQMLTKETIQHNIDCFKKQMSRFIDFSDGKALMVNNADWLLNLNYVDLLRDVGAHFSVNRMLTAECYKQRMERGLSFLEFNYMIMQSYDFYMLYQKYGCNMQFGGDDQWSNMLGGTELIRRKLGKDAYAMTITLLLNSEGKKMGKTQSGAVWLDPNKTSPFDFYQYWRNVDDADVIKCMRLLTFLPLEQIDEMAKWEGSQLNKAKEILAYELTNLVHGEEEAKKAQEGARALFSGGADTAHMPSTELTDEDFTEEGTIDLITMLIKTGLVPTRSEGRRAIEQGGVSIDGEKITDIKHTVAKDALAGDGVVLKRGKKKFNRVYAK